MKNYAMKNYRVQLRNGQQVTVEADRFAFEDGQYNFYKTDELIAAFTGPATEYVLVV